MKRTLFLLTLVVLLLLTILLLFLRRVLLLIVLLLLLLLLQGFLNQLAVIARILIIRIHVQCVIISLNGLFITA